MGERHRMSVCERERGERETDTVSEGGRVRERDTERVGEWGGERDEREVVHSLSRRAAVQI